VLAFPFISTEIALLVHAAVFNFIYKEQKTKILQRQQTRGDLNREQIKREQVEELKH